MERKRIRALAAMVTAGLLTAGAAWSAAPGSAAGSPAQLAGGRVRPGVIVMSHVGSATPLTTAQCQARWGLIYREGINGAGTSIAVVDAYGSPTIGHDLAVFDAAMGLPNPVLDIVQPEGKVPAYQKSNGNMVSWADETTLDVEWAHAAAPGARIVLVEASSDKTATIYGAVRYAVGHRLGDVVNQSWFLTVEPDTSAKTMWYWHDVAYAPSVREQVTVVVSSGDSGVAGENAAGDMYTHPVIGWPVGDPDVTAVGGTYLNLDADGNRISPDTVWNDTYNESVFKYLGLMRAGLPFPLATGGGKSAVFPRPSYQDGVQKVTGGSRGVPDISMSGSASGAVDMYESFGVPAGWGATGWVLGNGTSESTPLLAGVVALAAQVAGHSLGLIDPAIYRLAAEHARGIVPVTAGNNTVAYTENGKIVTLHGYGATGGYNLAVGVGTINAEYFVPELARLAENLRGRKGVRIVSFSSAWHEISAKTRSGEVISENFLQRCRGVLARPGRRAALGVIAPQLQADPARIQEGQVSVSQRLSTPCASPGKPNRPRYIGSTLATAEQRVKDHREHRTSPSLIACNGGLAHWLPRVNPVVNVLAEVDEGER